MPAAFPFTYKGGAGEDWGGIGEGGEIEDASFKKRVKLKFVLNNIIRFTLGCIDIK